MGNLVGWCTNGVLIQPFFLQFIIWASIPCQPVSSANRNKKEWKMLVNDLCVLALKRCVDCLKARVAFMENPAQGEYGMEHPDDERPAREVRRGN